jgi:hypothetical protein
MRRDQSPALDTFRPGLPLSAGSTNSEHLLPPTAKAAQGSIRDSGPLPVVASGPWERSAAPPQQPVTSPPAKLLTLTSPPCAAPRARQHPPRLRPDPPLGHSQVRQPTIWDLFDVAIPPRVMTTFRLPVRCCARRDVAVPPGIMTTSHSSYRTSSGSNCDPSRGI